MKGRLEGRPRSRSANEPSCMMMISVWWSSLIAVHPETSVAQVPASGVPGWPRLATRAPSRFATRAARAEDNR